MRYYPYSQHLKEKFGERTYKVVVSSGLTCPTRDGTLAKRGCAFCDLRGSSSYFGKKGRGEPVLAQLNRRIPEIRDRFGARKLLAYFQSYTNTYNSSAEELRTLYLEALSHPEISGLCIGTRPDCLPDEVILILEEIAREHYVSLELGVQSFEDPALLWLARGHDSACSQDALTRLKRLAPHVQTCVHLMFGTPLDSPSAPREAALLINALGSSGVKLHQLMILKGTLLAELWEKEPFPTLSLEQYTRQVGEFIAHLNPSVYIERLYATATHSEECLSPEWSRKRWEPHNAIHAYLESSHCMQGSALNTPSPFKEAGNLAPG